MIGFLVGIIVFGVLVFIIVSRLAKRRPKTLDQQYFQYHWAELLARVKTPEGMMLAIIDADKLLDEALKKSHMRGKTTGERLVSAQRMISDNDAVWYAHKLRNRLVHEPHVRLKKNEARNALAGFKQGLRDLGAF